jgi:hypothetical protein
MKAYDRLGELIHIWSLVVIVETGEILVVTNIAFTRVLFLIEGFLLDYSQPFRRWWSYDFARIGFEVVHEIDMLPF